MRAEGTGGRSYPADLDYSVLDGVMAGDDDFRPVGILWCANPRCGKEFTARAVGDMYCSEACDLDANPNLRGRK